MSTGFRGVARDVGVYGAGDAFVRLVSLAATPVFARVLEPDRFGLLTIATTLIGFLAAIAIVGGDSTYARFFFAVRTEEEQRTTTTTWIGFLSLWAALLALVSLVVAASVSKLLTGSARESTVFLVAMVTAPVAIVNTMLGQVLRNRFRSVRFVGFNVASAVLRTAFGLIALLVLDLGVVGVLGAALLAEALLVPMRFAATFGMFGRHVDRERLRQMLRFAIPLVPTSVAHWALLLSDRVLLGRLADLRTAGIYAVAATIAGAMMIANGAISQAWTPHAVRLYEDAPVRASERFGDALVVLVAGLGCVCLVLTAFSGFLVALVGGPGYESAAPAIAPLALGLVALGTGQVTSLGMTLRLRSGMVTVLSIVACALNIVLCLIWIPGSGLMGAAWASLVAYLVQTCLYLAGSQRVFPISLPFRRLAFVSSLVVLATGVAALLPDDGAWFIGRAALCAALPLALLASGALHADVMSTIRSVLGRA